MSIRITAALAANLLLSFELGAAPSVTEERPLAGATVVASFDPATGRVVPGPVTVRNPNEGYEMSGQIDITDTGEAVWYGRIRIRISSDGHMVPRGDYFRTYFDRVNVHRMVGPKTLERHREFIDPGLIPASPDVLTRLPPKPDGCRTPGAERPKGWVHWTIDCSPGYSIFYSPDVAFFLVVNYASDGRVKEQQLTQMPGMAGATFTRTWDASSFRSDDGRRLAPVGVTTYKEEADEEKVFDGQDRWAYRGPMRGLEPEGVGECTPASILTKMEMEPCEVRGGVRVDQTWKDMVARRTAYQLERQQEIERKRKARADRIAQLEAEAAEHAKREQTARAALEAQRAAAQRERQRQIDAENEEIDRANDALIAQQSARMQSEGQARNAKLKQDLADIERRRQEAQAAGDSVARQQAEQDRRNREEAARQERDRQAGERAYAESQARNAQAKAQAEAVYQQQRQIDQAKAQAAANDAARRAAGAYGATPNAPSGGYAGSSPTPSGGSALPKPDTSRIDRCAKLSRDIMSAGSDFHCNMNGKEFPTLGARRDAENACYAEVAAKVAPLKAQYKDECSSTAEGGATRY